ncbi:putative O-linked N-acetylglucosamine transferase, SPINDLY family [Bacteroidales bacterium Barb7]|nr:putative O-linked N-acetylglucosamine transferase, SPINDLY family [Bacteroidales bacterium Barb7]
MKRVLFLSIALCVAVAAAFAQKKAVSTAQSIVKGDKADFTEARSLIQRALEDPETKEDPKTWYVAGYIEDQQFSAERMKEMIGQKSNQPIMYEALIKELSFFEKAHALDQLPDAKGKIKPKFEKDIKGILSANHVYYINSGAYYFEEKEYSKAYESFEQFLKISDLPMFEGEKPAERDSNYMTVRFYAAVAATQLNEPETAIAALKRAAQAPDFRGTDVYQYLYNEYDQLNDTLNKENILKEAMVKFPDEPYFLLNLINIYIFSQRNEEAVDYLNQAIQKDPSNSMLYNALGSVYEDGFRDSENAEKNFAKAIEINPEYTDAISNLGRVFYNQAINKQGDANMITDNKMYQAALADAKSFFEKARPYFERAREIKSDEITYLIALRGIYYNLNMGKELAEIEELLK